ncbi:opsin-3-like [Hydractinia symbiolongicarpus]|uniref:opsin-3-like n=1 Tax=Hydractinia symbiolongicarpus TaxID=13093 RepID=UPI00254DFFDA|nr:opsin-3-like [Hydractinia symbiolongicarpus]
MLSHFEVVVGVLLVASSGEIIELGKTLFKCRDKPSTQYIFLCNIVLIMFTQTVFSTSTLFASAFFKEKILHGSNCEIDGFSAACCAFAMIMQMTLLCLQYVQSPSFEGKYKQTFSAVFSWIWGIIWAVFPFFGIAKWVPHGENEFCCLNFSSKHQEDRYYFFALFVFTFIIPVFFMVLCYYKCKFIKAKENVGKIAELTFLLNNVFSVALVLIVFWLPYGATSVLYINGYGNLVSSGVDTFSMFCGIFSYIVVAFTITSSIKAHLSEEKVEKITHEQLKRKRKKNVKKT